MKTFHSAIARYAVLLIIFFIDSSCVIASDMAAPVRSISIDASQVYLDNSITGLTIKDTCDLLKEGFPSAQVSMNNPQARIHIAIAGSGGKKGEGYEWVSSSRDNHIVLALHSPSFQGLSAGLYGLLQEKLGFKFYHPKKTIVPHNRRWPLPVNFKWKAFPRFVRRGFHIHTLHPIELTEQLHNPDFPHAAEDLKEYIDWLARNGQNTFQFYLLRDIDLTRWIRHAAGLVEYAHKRGIAAGVELSLFMIQQEAFQSIGLFRFFPSYTRQIDNTLSWIFQVKWDFITVNFSMGEYMPDLGEIMPDLKEYLIKQATWRYKSKVMIPTHVIGGRHWLLINHSDAVMNSRDNTSAKAGILIHTVMFYAIDENRAPVYGNSNLQHMLARAVVENELRETWYWPESAYWVSFDNSVPLLLLPYLDSRWADMNTMKKIGVDNHLTFSSGWEWGYWLIDWSIARWSWSYTEGGAIRQTSPLGLLKELFPAVSMQILFQRALTLQNYYFKDKGLIGLMSALDPSAELPWPFNSPFQPRPPFSNSWLLYGATDAETERIMATTVSDLESYSNEMNAVAKKLDVETARNYPVKKQAYSETLLIANELTRALAVTALRAHHRSLTIQALISQRKRHWWLRVDPDAEKLLQQAARVRLSALALVRQQEKIYRYPVSLIARQRKDFTAYHFGYLYPASDLFFWRREEEQVRHRRFDAFYMNIWNFWRISGLGSLYP